MSNPEPTPADEPTAPPADAPAAEPAQNRANRRAKPVKQAEPSHVGPRQDRRGKN